MKMEPVESKFYDTGDYKWSHGQIVDWHANRAPARWLLGPCPDCGSSTSSYGGGYRCHSEYCKNANFVCRTPDPTPAWWKTNVNVMKDGNAWCAFFDGFVNLQESDSGWGDTPNDAVAELLHDKKLDRMMLSRKEGRPA